MNELKVLDKRTILSGEFTIYGTPEEPLFVARDVADWIGHSNVTEMTRSIGGEEKLLSTILSGGQKREVTMLTEDGLYEVLFQSRLPLAKVFKTQVKQILKDIRRHGMYATPATVEAMIQDPTTMIKVLQALKSEQDQRQALEHQVERDKPRVLFSQAVEASEDSILIGDLAKVLKQNGVDVGQNRLFQWMRDKGYLIKSGSSRNMPTQYSMDRGWFEVQQRVIHTPGGEPRVRATTKVTGKGQMYFVNRFISDFEKAQ